MSIRLGQVVLWIIGLIWAFAGVAKVLESVIGQAPEAQTASWVSTFPSGLILFVSLIECGLAVLVFANRQWIAIIAGSLLLSSFTVALSVWPPALEQPCGCLGNIPILAEVDPLSKIIFFSGIHALTAALLWRGRIKKSAD